jgi:eukaryotic-like serine/threonine-protein kinase
LLYLQSGGRTRPFERANEVWALPLAGDEKPRQLTSTPFTKEDARFSPDGRWIAYQSNETGRMEIYIQSFSKAPVKQQVSTRGGTRPRWRRDGKELFYLDPELTLTAVSVQISATSVKVSGPTPLFQRPADSYYNVALDGRFLMDITTPRPLTVITNWATSWRQ